MTQELRVLLEELKFITHENCDECRLFSDDELLSILERMSGDVRASAYEVLMHKAQVDSITLPYSVSVESSRAYWLSLARLYRVNRGGVCTRKDEVNGYV